MYLDQSLFDLDFHWAFHWVEILDRSFCPAKGSAKSLHFLA